MAHMAFRVEERLPELTQFILPRNWGMVAWWHRFV